MDDIYLRKRTDENPWLPPSLPSSTAAETGFPSSSIFQQAAQTVSPPESIGVPAPTVSRAMAGVPKRQLHPNTDLFYRATFKPATVTPAERVNADKYLNYDRQKGVYAWAQGAFADYVQNQVEPPPELKEYFKGIGLDYDEKIAPTVDLDKLSDEDWAGLYWRLYENPRLLTNWQKRMIAKDAQADTQLETEMPAPGGTPRAPRHLHVLKQWIDAHPGAKVPQQITAALKQFESELTPAKPVYVENPEYAKYLEEMKKAGLDIYDPNQWQARQEYYKTHNRPPKYLIMDQGLQRPSDQFLARSPAEEEAARTQASQQIVIQAGKTGLSAQPAQGYETPERTMAPATGATPTTTGSFSAPAGAGLPAMNERYSAPAKSVPTEIAAAPGPSIPAEPYKLYSETAGGKAAINRLNISMGEKPSVGPPAAPTIKPLPERKGGRKRSPIISRQAKGPVFKDIISEIGMPPEQSLYQKLATQPLTEIQLTPEEIQAGWDKITSPWKALPWPDKVMSGLNTLLGSFYSPAGFGQSPVGKVAGNVLQKTLPSGEYPQPRQQLESRQQADSTQWNQPLNPAEHPEIVKRLMQAKTASNPNLVISPQPAGWAGRTIGKKQKVPLKAQARNSKAMKRIMGAK